MQLPKTTKYLLRFDDICPTMNWKVWSEIEAAMIEFQIKPILAVVPDNQDPTLRVDAAVEDFWDRVRQWQSWGWTIALHGYQHKYTHRSAGMITGLKNTEFAGFPAAQQEERLRRGLQIFQREGIKTHVWIAPNNSFDRVTASLLPRFGIYIICDGCFRHPFVDRRNMIWIPQQLHGFRPAPPGVWTVCYHHNYWTAADVEDFKEELRQFRDEIQTLDNALEIWGKRHSGWSSWLCTHPQVSHRLIRMELKLWEWWHEKRFRYNPPKTREKTLQPADQMTALRHRSPADTGVAGSEHPAPLSPAFRAAQQSNSTR